MILVLKILMILNAITFCGVTFFEFTKSKSKYSLEKYSFAFVVLANAAMIYHSTKALDNLIFDGQCFFMFYNFSCLLYAANYFLDYYKIPLVRKIMGESSKVFTFEMMLKQDTGDNSPYSNKIVSKDGNAIIITKFYKHPKDVENFECTFNRLLIVNKGKVRITYPFSKIEKVLESGDMYEIAKHETTNMHTFEDTEVQIICTK
jgi:hypothetical protein